MRVVGGKRLWFLLATFLPTLLVTTTLAFQLTPLTPPSRGTNHRRFPFVLRYRRTANDTSVDSSTIITSITQPTPNNNNNNVTTTTTTTQQGRQKKKRSVRNARELRKAVLEDGLALNELENDMDLSSLVSSLNHSVVSLMVKRFREGSRPGRRRDKHKLALSIEGGGMRGAVSAGMAAALACLGLLDTVDVVYGSSAGSVVGAYLVAQQMNNIDVYYDVLPNAKSKFVSKRRMLRSLLLTAVQRILPTTRTIAPGMNISHVLDGILYPTGQRPLDTHAFHRQDRVQPLRIVSSCVWSNGTLDTKCFGTSDYDKVLSDTGRRGVFACLEASMMVPGAAGPPVRMLDDGCFFDAFCFEPVPYRSAVAEGATHVMVLRSRPAGFRAKTQPTPYETAVAPLYFGAHRQPAVADFFARGGQQYRYLEDLMTCAEGQSSPHTPIDIPPTQLQYGLERKKSRSSSSTRNKAHLLPIAVPVGTPELPSLEQNPAKVLVAVRQGFAAAFDLLAPAVLGSKLANVTGNRAAELVFPAKDSRPVQQGDAHALLMHLPGIRDKGMSHLEQALQSAAMY